MCNKFDFVDAIDLTFLFIHAKRKCGHTIQKHTRLPKFRWSHFSTEFDDTCDVDGGGGGKGFWLCVKGRLYRVDGRFLVIQSRIFRLKIPNVPFYEVEYEDSEKGELQIDG